MITASEIRVVTMLRRSASAATGNASDATASGWIARSNSTPTGRARNVTSTNAEPTRRAGGQARRRRRRCAASAVSTSEPGDRPITLVDDLEAVAREHRLRFGRQHPRQERLGDGRVRAVREHRDGVAGQHVRLVLDPDGFDALHRQGVGGVDDGGIRLAQLDLGGDQPDVGLLGDDVGQRPPLRSEEHTSELQSLRRISYAVFCLKKKKKTTNNYYLVSYTYITQTKRKKN